MRIGIDANCLESQRGGVARILSNLLASWSTLTTRHQVVLYFEREVPADDFLKQPIFEHRIVPRPSLVRFSSIPREQIGLPLQMRRDRLDVFFAPWYYGPVVCPAPKLVVGVWDISFTTHRDHYPFREGLRLSLLSRHSCRRAAGVFTCSAYDQRQIERHYGVPGERICNLPLAPHPKFGPGGDPARLQQLRRKYGLTDRYILSLGVISNRRQVDVLIEGFRAVREEFPDASLLVVGRNHTQPRADIEGAMQALQAEGRGAYLSFAPEDELVDLYRGAWFYVCVSTVDGEATMLKEAMRCGTPVITSPLLEEAVGGHALVLEDPTNWRHVADGFRRALSDVELRAGLAEAGLAWSRTLSWDRVAKMSLEFLETR